MKTKGQIAYEAFNAAFLPRGIRPIAWEEVRDTARAAWESAAKAVSASEREVPSPGDPEDPAEVALGLTGEFRVEGVSVGGQRKDIEPVTVRPGDRILVRIGEGGAPSVSVEKRLTDEHMEALRRFAAEHGRTWKMKLRGWWESETLASHVANDDDVVPLYQVRNIIGPSGLAAVKL